MLFCVSLFVLCHVVSAYEIDAARYQISLKLDFDKRTFDGTERVRWTNRSDRATKTLYFHLYANMRADVATDGDEPHIAVSEIRLASSPKTFTPISNKQPLAFSFEDQTHTLLRVQLREAVASDETIELEIKFNGNVPEIDADETSLPAHVMQQVGAALNNTREVRRARDINFKARGMMLLGVAYPVLAAHSDTGEWQRKTELSIGDFVYTDVADYEATINAAPDVKIFTSGEMKSNSHTFAGNNLRHLAILAGRNLQSAEREVEGVRVRAVWNEGHEKIGRRTLDFAAEAVRIFTARFGALPLKIVTVAEAPLIAGFGCTEFAAFGIVASAYYVDFDSPAMKFLPEIVREQRSSVEDSLEFTVARVIAHQWWSVTVGNDPARAPLLDEAMSHWSAWAYFRERYGTERATQISDDQLRGVYAVYRAFGGEDMAAGHPSRDFRNSFQYAAIVSSKGALMLEALRAQLGDEKFFSALKNYYASNANTNAELEDLQQAFTDSAPTRKRDIARTFDRWTNEKHGDEDIAPPSAQLAAALDGLNNPNEQTASKERNAFARLGKFFWRQMTRIR